MKLLNDLEIEELKKKNYLRSHDVHFRYYILREMYFRIIEREACAASWELSSFLYAVNLNFQTSGLEKKACLALV